MTGRAPAERMDGFTDLEPMSLMRAGHARGRSDLGMSAPSAVSDICRPHTVREGGQALARSVAHHDGGRNPASTYGAGLARSGASPPGSAARGDGGRGAGRLSGGPDLLPRGRSSMRDVGVHGTSARGCSMGRRGSASWLRHSESRTACCAERGMNSFEVETISRARTRLIEPYHAADRWT